MAKSFEILESLFRSLRQVINLQILRLDELSTKKYPYNSSLEHIELIQDIYQKSLESIKKLEETYEKAQDENEYDEIEKDLIQLSQTLTWISGIAINLTTSSNNENVSQNTVFLLNHLIKPLNSEAKFLLSATDEHNYQITHWGFILNEFVKQFEIDASKLPQKPNFFSVLSFPSVFKDNIVAHSLMGHELGHFIILHDKLVNQISPFIELNEEKMGLLIAQKIKQTKSIQNKDELSNTITEKIRTDLQNNIRKDIIFGAEEILCDLIGFRIMGPVLVFAEVEFLLSDALVYQIGSFYPPPGLRLNVLLDELKSKGYMTKIKDTSLSGHCKTLISDIENFTNPEEISNYNLEEQIRYESWKKIISQLVKIADNIIVKFPELEYSSDMFADDLPPLIKKLIHFIPPCEIEQEKPANIISILNSGMIFRLLNKKLLDDPPENIELKIEPLVLRAIQQSIIQKTIQDELGD